MSFGSGKQGERKGTQRTPGKNVSNLLSKADDNMDRNAGLKALVWSQKCGMLIAVGALHVIPVSVHK